jgi:glycosyltransferase involved in cell wall biosynthesis
MRIALVTTSYPLVQGQAAGHFVACEAEALCRSGHRVIVIAPGPVSSISGDNPRIHRVPTGTLFGVPGALPRLRANPLRAAYAITFVHGARRALRAHGPFERVVAHWLVPSAWPIALAAGAPLEAVAHGSDVRLLRAMPRAAARCIIRQLLAAGSLRLASESLRSELALICGAAALRDARVEPCAIELPGTLDRTAARAGLGLPQDTRLIVINARLVPDKRVDSALRAVAALPDARIVVVGGGHLLEPLRRRFPAVRFTGQLARAEALCWTAAADVLVSASRHEGAPTAVREARALSVPVVALEAGDLSRWSARDDGLWVVPRSGLHGR